MADDMIPRVVATGDGVCLTNKIKEKGQTIITGLAERYAFIHGSSLPPPDKYWTSNLKRKRMIIRRPDGYALRPRKEISPPKVKPSRPLPESMSKFDRFKPRVQLQSTYDGLCSKEMALEHTEFAISRYNQANPGHKYVLVEVVGGTYCRFPRVYHLNFIAKPVDQSLDEEAMLFFGEVRRDRVLPELTLCRVCCILGPPGTVTGLRGCKLSCKKHPHLIQHPNDGFSKVPNFPKEPELEK